MKALQLRSIILLMAAAGGIGAMRAFGQMPVPEDPGMLFYIQRSTNANTIVYALNADEHGVPDRHNPVHVFWRRYQEDGRIQELDFIQRTFAYGIRSKHLGNAHELRCVAYTKLPLFLYPPAWKGAAPLVLVTVNGRTFSLRRIYLQIDGGSFWRPNVRYIEFNGFDVANNRPISERIIP